MTHMTYDQAIESIMPEVDSGSEEPFIFFRDVKGDWHVYFVYEQLEGKDNLLRNIKNRFDPLALMFTGKDFSKGSYSYVFDTVICDRIRAEWDINKNGDYRTSYYISLEKRDTESLINLFEDNVSEFSNDVMEHLTSVRKPLSELARLCPYKLFSYDKEYGYNMRLASKAIDRIEFFLYKRNHLNKERSMIKKPASIVMPLSLTQKLSKAKEKADKAAESKADYNITTKQQNRTEER